ncbi:unnamed protein product [Caenorhabditis angaria]|uniref:Uncharacterized protein n=1 Tax=Caenorhabditis angaria TaxID=860376 RepID=A0A9P1INK6_9PELO|nr:unnamed protein product [Caenorhabditis angaria]
MGPGFERILLGTGAISEEIPYGPLSMLFFPENFSSINQVAGKIARFKPTSWIFKSLCHFDFSSLHNAHQWIDRWKCLYLIKSTPFAFNKQLPQVEIPTTTGTYADEIYEEPTTNPSVPAGKHFDCSNLEYRNCVLKKLSLRRRTQLIFMYLPAPSSSSVATSTVQPISEVTTEYLSRTAYQYQQFEKIEQQFKVDEQELISMLRKINNSKWITFLERHFSNKSSHSNLPRR